MRTKLAGGGSYKDGGSSTSGPAIRASLQDQLAGPPAIVSARSLLFGISHSPRSAVAATRAEISHGPTSVVVATSTGIRSSSSGGQGAGSAPPTGAMREPITRLRHQRRLVATEVLVHAAAGLPAPRKAAAVPHHTGRLGRVSSSLIFKETPGPAAADALAASAAPRDDTDGHRREQPLRRAAAVVPTLLELGCLGPDTLLAALRLSLQSVYPRRAAAASRTVAGTAAAHSRPDAPSGFFSEAASEPLVSPQLPPAAAGNTDLYLLLQQCRVLQSAAADRAGELMCAAVEAVERALQAERCVRMEGGAVQAVQAFHFLYRYQSYNGSSTDCTAGLVEGTCTQTLQRGLSPSRSRLTSTTSVTSKHFLHPLPAGCTAQSSPSRRRYCCCHLRPTALMAAHAQPGGYIATTAMMIAAVMAVAAPPPPRSSSSQAVAGQGLFLLHAMRLRCRLQ